MYHSASSFKTCQRVPNHIAANDLIYIIKTDNRIFRTPEAVNRTQIRQEDIACAWP